MREIEQIYQQHYRTLQNMEDQYQRQIQQKYGKNKQQLQQEVQRRQRAYDEANGGNRWGDVASPQVRAHHERKLNEAVNNLNDANSMERELDGLREAVRRLEQQRQSATGPSNSINDMQVRNPGTNQWLHHQTTNLLFGMHLLHGAHALVDYANPDLLRQQDRLANGVSQRMGEYNGVNSADRLFRGRMRDVGLGTNFGTLETGATANILAQGGIGTGQGLLKDLGTAQYFSRAYGQDPNQISGDFATLQKMGTFNEGEMNRFADLIGGAVAKNSMQGREGEMLQATMGLIQQVSQGQISINQQQAGGLAGMQVALGQDIPALKGQAGANLLAGWDNAIKNGGQSFDLIMGKGTNPQYTGLNGSYQLQLLKEQGLNPKTAKTFFSNMDSYFGNGPNSDAMKGFAYEQMGFGTALEYEKLRKSGFIDQIEKGKLPSASQLKKIGANDLAKQFQNYQNSQTSQVDYQNAQKENQKADYQQPFDAIGKFMSNTWFKIPEEVRMPLLTAGFLGGSSLAYKGVQAIGSRILSPTVRSFMGGGGGGVGGLLARAGSAIKGVGGKIGGAALNILGDTTKSIPILGATVETVADRVSNPQHSWGRSLAKGIGSGIGTAAGIFASGLVDVGTGGLGILTNAGLTVGGGMAGSWLGDKVYSMFAGDSDTKTSSSKKTTTASKDATAKDQEYALAQSVDKLNKNNEVKVTVSGKIDGMTADNQKNVSDSISTYFSNATNNFNLAFDQRRG
jgi:hypothetical protein